MPLTVPTAVTIAKNGKQARVDVDAKFRVEGIIETSQEKMRLSSFSSRQTDDNVWWDEMDRKVSIIILNWNGWRDTIKCLESLTHINYDNFDVVVLDNGSKDNSIKQIRAWAKRKARVESSLFGHTSNNRPIRFTEYKREEIESWDEGKARKLGAGDFTNLILLRNERNYGFSEGNNIGVRYALSALNPDYVFLLNNDTVVEKRFLREIVRVAEKNYPHVGVLQSKLMMMDDSQRIDCTGGFVTRIGGGWDRGWGEIDKGQYNKDVDIFYAKGAALMIRTDIVRKIGLFDPTYMIYYDDTDLCWRVRLAGYKIILCAKSIVYHKGMGTVKKQPSTNTLYSSKKNQVAMLLKNYDGANLVKNLTRLFIRDVIRRTASILFKNVVIPLLIRKKRDRTLAELGPILNAYLWNIAHLRYIWKMRAKNQKLIRKIPDSMLPFMKP